MSVVGTLAAVVGILFVLSGFVTSLPYSGATSASTAASSSTSAGAARNGSAASSASGPVESTTPAGVAQNSTPPAQQAQGIQAAQDPDYRQAQGADNGQAATAKDQKESAPQGAPSPSVLSFLDIGAPGVRIGLGILLFIAGAMGIAVGRDRGKRVNT